MAEKKQLSIALVSSYAFTEEPGGVKDFILGLKEALQKLGCKVNVIAPGSKDAKEKGLINFVLGFGIEISTDQTKFRVGFSRKTTAKKILDEIKPDVIVIHEPVMPTIGHSIISSVEKMKIGKRPIIVGQFHGRREGLDRLFNAIGFIGRNILRHPTLDRKTVLGLSSGYISTIENNLDGRIAVSEATKNFWQKHSPANYKVIYNGIDTDKLSPNPTSPSLRGTKIIFFAGRHDRRKGIDDLIDAFNILVKDGLRNIKLRISGFGEMTGFLKKKVKKLGLEKLVEFVGILPYEKLIQAYRSADLVVAPSTGGEGFNRTIIEARSCGTLVVCTDIEGHREAIGKDLFPFMAEPKNPEHLAKQIKTVLNLPEAEKQKIKKQGREEVKSHFDWSIIALQHLAYYKSLM